MKTTAAIKQLEDKDRTRCEIWTRVMGYHRPVSAWNPGKQAEHAERTYYRETTAGSTVDNAERSEAAGRSATAG
jgi:hypothetical protein